MSNLHNERYDEIKKLVNNSRMLIEQLNAEKLGPYNVAKSIEDKIDDDEEEYETSSKVTGEKEADDEYVQKYRVSGGIIAIHGKDKSDTDITTDDKIAFQETMDDFAEEVSDLVDFNQLNVYPTTVEWSGKIIDRDLDFIYTIGESSGTYINGNMLKVDDDTLETINKLKSFFEKFKSKWSKVLASKKQTIADED